MWKQLQVNLRGESPLIQHNGLLADPAYPYTKAIKEITKKRIKTDADFEEIDRLSFLGALYVNEQDRVVVPAYVIENMIVEGAKKSRQGKVARAGMYVEQSPLLVYEGPTDKHELWQGKAFVHRALVNVQRSKIIRVRPIFNQWAVSFEVFYDDKQVKSESTLLGWIKTAGEVVGMGDWRPKYGRFEVV